MEIGAGEVRERKEGGGSSPLLPLTLRRKFLQGFSKDRWKVKCPPPHFSLLICESFLLSASWRARTQVPEFSPGRLGSVQAEAWGWSLGGAGRGPGLARGWQQWPGFVCRILFCLSGASQET